VGQIGHLGLQRGLAALQEALAHVAQLAGVLDRTMLEYPFARLEAQVQAVEGGIALFQFVHHPQALQIVLEAARLGRQLLHAGVQFVLAGMAERRVAQVVRQGDGLDEVFVQAQVASDGARQLGHFQAMGQARAEQIPFVVDEDLGLVFQQAEGVAVDDAVPVPLEGVAALRRGFRVTPAAGLFRMTGISGKRQHGGYSGTAGSKRASAWRTTSGSTAWTTAWPRRSSNTKRSWPPSFFLSTCISSSQRSADQCGGSVGQPLARTRARMRATSWAGRPQTSADSSAAMIMPQPTASPGSHCP